MPVCVLRSGPVDVVGIGEILRRRFVRIRRKQADAGHAIAMQVDIPIGIRQLADVVIEIVVTRRRVLRVGAEVQSVVDVPLHVEADIVGVVAGRVSGGVELCLHATISDGREARWSPAAVMMPDWNTPLEL